MPDNIDTENARQTTSDIQVTGNPDVWQLVCKASSKQQGWMKSTKRMKVTGGYVIQVSTEHRVDDKVTTSAEALVFVPGEVPGPEVPESK